MSSSGLLLFVQVEEDMFCCIIKIGTCADIEEKQYHHFFNLCFSYSTLGLFVVNKLNLTMCVYVCVCVLGGGGVRGSGRSKPIPNFLRKSEMGGSLQFHCFHLPFSPDICTDKQCKENKSVAQNCSASCELVLRY